MTTNFYVNKKQKKLGGGDRAFTLLNNRKANLIGFTLIELLIVVAIIGIIAGIIVVTVQNAIHRATIARSLSFSRAIEQTLGLDLRGFWPFNGRALDRSGWNNHGTLHNFTPTTGDWVPGVIGEALRFDGVNDFVNVPHSASLNITDAITMEFWLWLTDLTGFDMLIDKNRDVAYNIHFFDTTDKIRVMLAGTIHDSSFAFTPATLNKWVHIVVTFDRNLPANQLKLYINGTLDSVFTRTAPIGTNTLPVRIGVDHNESFPFDGRMDEVRIYSRVMPRSYIQKRYVQGVKSLAENGGITQEEKQERLTALRNSGQLVIDLDAVLVGPIDFSVYNKYLVLEKTE